MNGEVDELSLSPAQLKRVHVALEESRGNVARAAILIGTSAAGLAEIIESYPELASYRPAAGPPSEDAVMLRNRSVAKRNEPQSVNEGFRSIGFSQAEADGAVALADFGRNHFAALRNYSSGCMATLLRDLIDTTKEVAQEIRDANPDDTEKQKALREDRSRLVSHCLALHDRVTQAALVNAQIAAKKQEARDAGSRTKPGPPAFAPLAMKVDGNVTVVQSPPSQNTTSTEGTGTVRTE